MPTARGHSVGGMPHEWLSTSVVRHIDDPFSAAALAEPSKTCIDLGPVNIEACFGASESGMIKDHGQETTIPDSEPKELIRAHNLFINAGRLVLGEERFMDSQIVFTYRRSIVKPGERQLGRRAHIDQSSTRELRLIGLACNVLPTILFNGGVSPDGLDEYGSLINLRNLNARFKFEPIPTSRLILAPPAMIHDIARLPADAPEPVDRLFMRWHLRV